MSIDVVVFTGHKCLMGPAGIVGNYVIDGVPVRYSRFGGTGVRSAQLTYLEEFPYRLECRTFNLLGVDGLHAGVNWVLEQGIAIIHNQEINLWDHLRKGLQRIDNFITYCAENTRNQNPVLSFNIFGFDSGDVGTMVDVGKANSAVADIEPIPR